MSTLDLTASRMESFSDWMNPILVKETRQALKSRQFLATFMLLLIACWLICLMGVAIQGASMEYGAPSTSFFTGFYAVLGFAVMVVIPFTSFRSLLSEQESQTYELLSITALTPRQIVWGKFLNSAVQVVVFYCAIAPFIAFTSLLQGFDMVRTLIAMTSLFGVSLLLCMITLMLSTVARSKQIQTLSSLFIIGGLISGYSTMMGITASIMNNFVDTTREFYWALAFMWLIGLSYFVLFMQITIAQLMVDAANKSTGVRLVATAQFVLFWGLLLISYWATGISLSRDVVESMVVFSLIHWAAFGFFICMERDHLSRRIRREISHRPLLRFLSIPFMPGGARGFLLVLINLVALVCLVGLFLPPSSSAGNEFEQGIMACIAYTVIYLGIGCFLTRNLLKISTDMDSMHGRTLLIVLVAIGAIAPYFLLWMLGHYDDFNPTYSILQITNPIETIHEINNQAGGGPTGLLALLMMGAAVAVLLNLKAILVSAYQILWPDRPAINSLHPKPATSTEV